jgi:small subunit ribosomal protein S23
MGRLNLTALNVRKIALQNLKTQKTRNQPAWLEIVGDIPPAQILTRQQPVRHPLTKVRTRTLPGGKTEQHVHVVEQKKSRSTRGQHLFTPTPLRYEEDTLRKRFFSDHPWELARPRVVLETSGDQYKNADWSKGLQQPGVSVTGESVVQRQLWLLENVPDITVPQAYDIARKEFYALRRQEETRSRIAAEEARHMGAQFGKSAIQVSMGIENRMYNDWENWSRMVVDEFTQRAAAFEGTITAAEDQTLKEVAEEDGQTKQPAIGAGVFAQQQQRDSRSQRRTV